MSSPQGLVVAQDHPSKEVHPAFVQGGGAQNRSSHTQAGRGRSPLDQRLAPRPLLQIQEEDLHTWCWAQLVVGLSRDKEKRSRSPKAREMPKDLSNIKAAKSRHQNKRLRRNLLQYITFGQASNIISYNMYLHIFTYIYACKKTCTSAQFFGNGSPTFSPSQEEFRKKFARSMLGWPHPRYEARCDRLRRDPEWLILWGTRPQTLESYDT